MKQNLDTIEVIVSRIWALADHNVWLQTWWWSRCLLLRPSSHWVKTIIQYPGSPKPFVPFLLVAYQIQYITWRNLLPTCARAVLLYSLLYSQLKTWLKSSTELCNVPLIWIRLLGLKTSCRHFFLHSINQLHSVLFLYYSSVLIHNPVISDYCLLLYVPHKSLQKLQLFQSSVALTIIQTSSFSHVQNPV